MTHLLLRHYGAGIEHVKSLPFLHGKLVMEQAREQERIDRAWEAWLMQYQHMDQDNFVSFEDFYRNIKMEEDPGPSRRRLDPKEILERAERIKQADLEQGRR